MILQHHKREKKMMSKKIIERIENRVWVVKIEAVSKVFATEEEAQKYTDKMNKENIFKVKKLDVNPANLKPK